MKTTALLSYDMVAKDAEDEIEVLFSAQAPAAPTDVTRDPASVVLVLDRSGSMGGPPLEAAKKALTALVRRLDPIDNFGLVTFDDEARCVVAAGPLNDKSKAIQRIQSIQAGASTDLGVGYLLGLRELRRVATNGGRLLVISDGHVNSGLRDADEFASIAGKAYGEGIVTSTLGYGEGYDEWLLSTIARSGNGNHVFAADPDAATAAVAGEIEGLLGKVAQAVSLTVRCTPAVRFLHLYNDVPCHRVGDGAIQVELGDLYAEEERRVLLRFKVPAMAALGLARIATLTLTYVAMPGLVEQTISLPVMVNVVPGDEATGRIPDPTVRTEKLFQEAQEIKRQAAEAFRRNDLETARRLLLQTAGKLHDARGCAPAAKAGDIEAEIAQVQRMTQDSFRRSSSYLSKQAYASYHASNRKTRPTDDAAGGAAM